MDGFRQQLLYLTIVIIVYLFVCFIYSIIYNELSYFIMAITIFFPLLIVLFGIAFLIASEINDNKVNK